MSLPRCPQCSAKVIQKSMDGKVRIRTNIVAFDDNKAEVVCKKCGTGVPIDIQLGDSLRKALSCPKLVVRKNAKDEEFC